MEVVNATEIKEVEETKDQVVEVEAENVKEEEEDDAEISKAADFPSPIMEKRSRQGVIRDSLLTIKKRIHLVFVIHGIGATAEKLRRHGVRIKENFDKVWNSNPNKFRRNYHFKMINWKKCLPLDAQAAIERITIEKHSSKRSFVNSIPTDILFYMVAEHSSLILSEVTRQCNEYYQKIINRGIEVDVSIMAHSLGSLIFFDLLDRIKKGDKGLSLDFNVNKVFFLGSPLGLFVSITRDAKFEPLDRVGLCQGFFNIFHPSDLVAYRVEPLIPDFPSMQPETLKSFATEVKETKKDEKGWSFFGIFCCGRERASSVQYYSDPSGRSKRYDYQVLENVYERYIEAIGLLTSHFSYWDNNDIAYFILRKLNNM
eukprot:TRINITY_DN4336_c0_g4_i5.p1 TRINITY_DN4336_c0_g4~~TRINITY_DN4336_c0_g4_i5.p1  ORF type:complete len:371 (+),score=74.64 TRINITY_DN4336_c0_g4_i5:130-1242(+)